MDSHYLFRGSDNFTSGPVSVDECSQGGHILHDWELLCSSFGKKKKGKQTPPQKKTFKNHLDCLRYLVVKHTRTVPLFFLLLLVKLKIVYGHSVGESFILLHQGQNENYALQLYENVHLTNHFLYKCKSLDLLIWSTQNVALILSVNTTGCYKRNSSELNQQRTSFVMKCWGLHPSCIADWDQLASFLIYRWFQVVNS